MLSAFAEPLLDPFIIERVSYAHQKNIFVNLGFSTNGSLLTSEMYRKLAKAGLKSITVSVDGFNKKSYEKIRVGIQYERIEQNILETLNVHKEMGAPISININSFTRENRRELSRSNLYKALVDAGIKPGLKWRVDNWGGNVSEVGGGLRLMRLPKKKGPCALLYDSSV
jgi:MoaA/NifB/PqqE/SkfB family radical SAM enzyme